MPPFHFTDAGAQMIVYDVNGDGLADVIIAWHCHHYGLVWWQQVDGADGPPDWKQRIILSPDPNVGATEFRVSQLHAMDLVDMTGDGMNDIVTGKLLSGEPQIATTSPRPVEVGTTFSVFSNPRLRA